MSSVAIELTSTTVAADEPTPTHVNRDGHVQDACQALAAGAAVVVVAGAEAHLVVAGGVADTAVVAQLIRHGSGFLLAAAPGRLLDRLRIPPGVSHGATGRERHSVSFDARTGVTTGISAEDRGRTLRLLADPATAADDLVRPGHVIAVRAPAAGVLEDCSAESAATDLVRLAGLGDVAGLCALVDDDGEVMDRDRALTFATSTGLRLVTVDDVIGYRLRRDPPLDLLSGPTADLSGGLAARRYRDRYTGAEHIAYGTPRATSAMAPELIMVTVGCRLGHALGFTACGCRGDLDAAVAVAQTGGGIVLNLAASRAHSLAVDAAAMLAALGITRVHLLRPGFTCDLADSELRALPDGLRAVGVDVDTAGLISGGPIRQSARGRGNVA